MTSAHERAAPSGLIRLQIGLTHNPGLRVRYLDFGECPLVATRSLDLWGGIFGGIFGECPLGRDLWGVPPCDAHSRLDLWNKTPAECTFVEPFHVRWLEGSA